MVVYFVSDCLCRKGCLLCSRITVGNVGVGWCFRVRVWCRDVGGGFGVFRF